MRRSNVLTASMLIVLCIGFYVFQQFNSSSPHPTVLGAAVTDAPAKQSSCHEKNGLADPTCTPGSTNPSVTQANIQSTICTSGYTKTIRPPTSYTQSLKKQQIIAYGYLDTNVRDYEEDHLISLELGGNPTDPKNLWPEPGASPNPKDSIENTCNQKVCNGQLTLSQAQKEIATNWKIACQ